MYWQDGKLTEPLATLDEIRETVQKSLKTLRTDHKRTLNPTPYKVITQSTHSCLQFLSTNSTFSSLQVSVSDDLYNFIHDLWLQNAPIGELS